MMCVQQRVLCVYCVQIQEMCKAFELQTILFYEISIRYFESLSSKSSHIRSLQLVSVFNIVFYEKVGRMEEDHTPKKTFI